MFWAAPRIVPKESHRGDSFGELHDKLQSVCRFCTLMGHDMMATGAISVA